jgi:hypothetical protein
MNVPDISHLEPWINTLGSREKRRRDFFTYVFSELVKTGFVLENPDAIEGGYRLSFLRGNSWVIADRYASYPVAGETAGVSLYNESEEWECSFSARSPVGLVIEAIEHLTADEE